MGGSGLLLLILLGLVIWFWQNTLRARELAFRATHELCRLQQYQLLDSTVTLQRIELVRSDQGRMQFKRTFQFAYSDDGDSRYSGFVIVAGNHVEQVGL